MLLPAKKCPDLKCQNNRVVRIVRSVNVYEIEAKSKISRNCEVERIVRMSTKVIATAAVRAAGRKLTTSRAALSLVLFILEFLDKDFFKTETFASFISSTPFHTDSCSSKSSETAFK